MGGHDVTDQKNRERYQRSLNLVRDVLPATNRAFFYDTSEEESWCFANCIEGKQIQLESDEMPKWLKW